MVVIAMTREMGTLGKDVAQGLADQMGLRVVHQELVEHGVAGRLGMPESAVHRYLEGNATLLERWKIDSTRFSGYTAEEILQLALEGNVVIRGWGATALLHEIPHVICVRVCAPLGCRERVMMERLGTEDVSWVRREIERSDAAHARTVRGLFNLDWESPLLYHLVLNTGSVPIDACVGLVRQLAESPAFQETEDSRSVIADRLLQARVRSLLIERFGSGGGFTGLEARARKGKVRLTGVAFDPRLAAEAAKLVRDVAGVTDVDLRIMVVQSRAGGL